MFFQKIYYHLKSLVKKLFYKILFGKKFEFHKSLNFRNGFICTIDKGKIEIGKEVFFNNNVHIHSRKKIKIGDNCIFGESVKIYDHNHVHEINGIPFSNQGFTDKEVSIGNNIWIGSNVTILPGVSIGDNSVIGSGVVIQQDVPENSVIVLNRASFINIQNVKRGVY